jgi:hypothetical protein
MATESFAFQATLRADARLAPMVRAVVADGARRTGCGDAEASTFGATVERAYLAAFAGAPPDARVSIDVRSPAGQLEVVVTGPRGARTLVMDG